MGSSTQSSTNPSLENLIRSLDALEDGELIELMAEALAEIESRLLQRCTANQKGDAS